MRASDEYIRKTRNIFSRESFRKELRKELGNTCCNCGSSENIEYHLEKDHISTTDVEWELESWDYIRDYDVRADHYGITIYDMNSEDYEEVDSNIYSWLESWGNDLDDEYGSEEDEDEEDEYEEDEYEEDEE